jgi:hypothetical protein
VNPCTCFWPRFSLIQLSLKPHTVTIRVLDNRGVQQTSPSLISRPCGEGQLGDQKVKITKSALKVRPRPIPCPSVWSGSEEQTRGLTCFPNYLGRSGRDPTRSDLLETSQTSSGPRSDLRSDLGLFEGLWLCDSVFWPSSLTLGQIPGLLLRPRSGLGLTQVWASLT